MDQEAPATQGSDQEYQIILFLPVVSIPKKIIKSARGVLSRLTDLPTTTSISFHSWIFTTYLLTKIHLRGNQKCIIKAINSSWILMISASFVVEQLRFTAFQRHQNHQNPLRSDPCYGPFLICQKFIFRK